ncbi:hypothetical protein R1sor_019588 [Riccia sorocarpa]|uniref:DDE-1 domain-containing protein n=1 Tax=Riccia sorocarpa TaxID=122646 RepID=A0ABD3IE10_9MARC
MKLFNERYRFENGDGEEQSTQFVASVGWCSRFKRLREPKSTIEVKGSREILMRKGGTSHKRFTETFGITLDGRFLKSHLLFSKLKNKPAVKDNCLVDVNQAGMWNDEVLLDYVKATVLNRHENAFLREPTLLVLDSYGVHVRLFAQKKLSKYIVFVVIVPPNLTSILQPSDVGVNRSYQKYYSTCYDEYISRVLENLELQTKAGNPKVPGYRQVSDWTVD